MQNLGGKQSVYWECESGQLYKTTHYRGTKLMYSENHFSRGYLFLDRVSVLLFDCAHESHHTSCEWHVEGSWSILRAGDSIGAPNSPH